MTIRHHPSDEIVMSYANGSLAPELAIVVGAHLTGCDVCRETLGIVEAIGGTFLTSMPPAEMAGDAFASVLAHLDSPSVMTVQPPATRNSTMPDLSASLRLPKIGRKRWLAPGIWITPILKDSAKGTRAYLLGAAAGKALPRHGHCGIEWTQVLQGEFFDGDVRYGPGDFLEADGEHEHRPIVGNHQECICSIASEGVPRGLVGLLMRAFT
jgi:putative transcriptional regulator